METDHPDVREASHITRGAAITGYRIEFSGPLPVGLIEEITGRFAPVDVRLVGHNVSIRTGGLDQSALRALLGLIWDVGGELGSITKDTSNERTKLETEKRRS